MVFNGTASTTNFSSHIRSVFYCPSFPNFVWDLNSTTYAWILVAIRCIASPCAIALNTLVIVTMKKKKVLKKSSTILLSSMAVTDLLTGAVVMPSSAAVDILIFRQTSFAHICLIDSVNVSLTGFLSMCSLYHLTVIAWERYVAIRKWMDYKLIVTTGRVKKLVIAGWLSMIFLRCLDEVMLSAGVDKSVVEGWYYVQGVVGIIFIILLFYFYIMVYLGIRKREINEISQVTALVKAKLESKVAKTTFMLTTVVLFSFVPWGSLWFFQEIFPVIRTNSGFRSGETCVYLNSLISPVVYCYRDRRFRNALKEMLGMRKPQAMQPAVGAMRAVRRNVPRGSVKNAKVAKRNRFSRSESCDLAMVLDCVHQNNEITLKRSMSAPTLCNGCFDNETPLQKPLPILSTTAIIHVQSGVLTNPREGTLNFPSNVKAELQGTARSIYYLSRSASWDACAAAEFAERWQDLQDRNFGRFVSARCASTDIIVLDDTRETDFGFNTRF